MSGAYSDETIKQLARQLQEPIWITELRRKALARHQELPWPHKSDDIWRRTDVSLLDPAKGFAPAEPGLLQQIRLTEPQAASYTQPLGGEQLLVRANGIWLTEPSQDRGGVLVQETAQADRSWGEKLRQAIEADGFTDAEWKLASLNLAFHHDDVAIKVPAGYVLEQPIRLVHLFSAVPHQAIFPLTVITVGAGSSVTLIDEYVSLGDHSHLINGRIELVLEPDAKVHYVRLQRWAGQGREFLLQRATLAKGSTLTMANLHLGSALSKAHVVTKLMGGLASTKLYGFVFGKGQQHIDQHTLQDHHAPHTFSDLEFKAALQDQSHMIYTGLIRIAKEAKQTQAFQANHNLLLSQEAKAETIPMLEILADDVQCKHGASIGPIDDEQAFYLMSRGVSREIAQRLIVMGFVESIIKQVPFEPLQERLRQEIEGNLHA